MTLNEHDLYETTVLWHKPFWQNPFFYWSCVICIAVIVLFCLYFGIKKWQQKKVSIPTAAQQALYDIMLLQQHNLVNGARAKEFYARLTTILKKFFFQTNSIGSESMTDDELIAYLIKYNIYQDVITDLQNIFTGTVQIKFATKQGVQEHIERDLRSSINFIKNIMQKTDK